MSRIVAGVAGGRRIAMPPGRDTRPTSDRVREALFASLLSELADFEGRAFLDLYAGSGAVGCEALSRGAAYALLVESDRKAAAVIRQNLRELRLAGGELVVGSVERIAASPAGRAYDVAFLDPPYALAGDRVGDVLADLRRNGWLAPDAIVVVERSARSADFGWPEGFTAARSRRYGDTVLWYGHAEHLTDTVRR